MMPTIDSKGELFLVDAFSYWFHGREYRIGDIVICKCPYNMRKMICKRIKAVEGTIITTEVEENGRRKRFSETVPAGYVWLEGDNSKYSLDSRKYGLVPLRLVQGRLAYKLSNFQPLP